VPSLVAPGYAPPGAHLVSAADDELLPAVRAQLEEWFGARVRAWRHLRTYRIAHAQPDQAPPAAALAPGGLPPRLASGVFLCGDHRRGASIHHALLSGRLAAEAVLAATPD
jgi:predicted NAD/FAD-dependent oxidoreductase